MKGGTQPLLASYNTPTLQAFQWTRCYWEVALFFMREGEPNYRTPNPAWRFSFLPSYFLALLKFAYFFDVFNISTFINYAYTYMINYDDGNND